MASPVSELHKVESVFVKACIGGVETYMLVDSGATPTIISSRLWDLMKIDDKTLTKPQTVETANGSGLLIDGRTESKVWLTLGSLPTRFNIQPLVAQNLTVDAILGLDFLMGTFAADILLSQGVLVIQGRNIPLIKESELQGTCRVVVDQNHLIPPGSESLVNTRVIPHVGQVVPQHGVLEPNLSVVEKTGILVARTVNQVKDGHVPIRVMNVTNDEIILYNGIQVGELCPLVDCFTASSEKCYRLVQQEHSTNTCRTATSLPNNNSKALQKEMSDVFKVDQLDLNASQKHNLVELLVEYSDVVSRGSTDLGQTNILEHEINLVPGAQPIRQRFRRLALPLAKELKQQINDWEDNGVIEPSSSPWASPVVPVMKKDGTTRFCCDFRKLNEVTIKDSYPIPRIDDTIDSLSGSSYFSSIDLVGGYLHMNVREQDRSKTAFTTPFGLYQFRRMPFGLTNAPASFSRLMELALRDLTPEVALVYLDDVIVHASSFEEHLTRLRRVFERFRRAGLKVKPAKCQLCCTSVNYLGYVVSRDGISPNPSLVQVIADWPIPSTVTEVRSFLGKTSYYRRFIPNFASIAAPLHKLSEKDSRFKWTSDCAKAFNTLKTKLMSPPVLTFPDFKCTFILDTDASDTGIGGVLSQVQDGVEKVIAYGSRSMTKAERRYGTTKREMLALVHFCKVFKPYLWGREFVARTDHKSLEWLRNFRDPPSQIARWMELLAEFPMKIVHRPGKDHQNADALSRIQWNGVHSDASNQQVKDAEKLRIDGRCYRVDKSLPNPFSIEDLKEAQATDPICQQGLQWCTDNKRPNRDDMHGQNLAAWSLWSQFERLVVHNGILYRRWVDTNGSNHYLQLVLPKKLVPRVLDMLHNQPTAGHLGVDKTTAKVRSRFYWHGLYKDVAMHIAQCQDCAKRKNPKSIPKEPLIQRGVGYPMDRIHVDILGPLPMTRKGNKFILVVNDAFTKWPECFSLPNQLATTIADCLYQNFFCRFGMPANLHADQGRNFESNLFTEVMSLLGISKTRTTAYHPQSNGEVERFNRTIAAMLSHYVAADQRDWDDYLPTVLLAYRSSVHSSTKQTPFMLMFGRELSLPVDVMFGQPPNQKKSVIDYVAKLREDLDKAYEEVRMQLEVEQRRQKDYYDREVRPQRFKAGDRVWLFVPAIKKGCAKKLCRPWKGPFKVVELVTDVLARIQTTANKTAVVHFNRLKPCLADEGARQRPEANLRPKPRKLSMQDRTEEVNVDIDIGIESEDEDWCCPSTTQSCPVPDVFNQRPNNPPEANNLPEVPLMQSQTSMVADHHPVSELPRRYPRRERLAPEHLRDFIRDK